MMHREICLLVQTLWDMKHLKPGTIIQIVNQYFQFIYISECFAFMYNINNPVF